MLTDHILLQAKRDFMISIGKISLRNSQSTAVKGSQLVPMSYLPLINSDIALPTTNQEHFKKNSTDLTLQLIRQADACLNQILQRKSAWDQHEKNMGYNITVNQNHFMAILE